MLQDKSTYNFHAFICYSHRDRKWGNWLHKALERYRIPKRVIREHKEKDIPNRLFPVFRDREELSPAKDLGEKINQALADSDSLVVICSPDSAKSEWVNKEIKRFKQIGREGRIYCLIVAGEPDVSDGHQTAKNECFPEAVRFNVTDDGQITSVRAEPIAANARKDKDGKRRALIKLVASIIDVPFDELWQRDQVRKTRQLTGSIIAALALALLFAGIALFAVNARDDARIQRDEAIRQSNRANLQETIAKEEKKSAQRERDNAIASEKLAEKRRIEASQQRDLALKAIEGLTYDVPDRLGKLPGSIPIITDILNKNLALLERIGSDVDAGSIGKVLRHKAANHEKIADRWLLIGNTQNALESFSRSETILKKLNDRKHDMQSRHDLALLDSRIGAVQRRSGNLHEAEKRHRAALESSRKLVREHPDNPDLLRAVSANWQELGDDMVMRVQQYDALTAYTQFHLSAEFLARKYKKDEDRRYLATALDKMALIHDQLGDLKSALLYAERSVDITKKLAKDPLDVPLRRELVTAWQRLGDLRLKNMDYGKALVAFQAMTMIADELAADPTNMDARRNAAIAHRELGRVYLENKQVEKAAEEVKTSLSIFETVSRDPFDRNAVLQLTSSYELRAKVFKALKKPEESAEDLLEVIRLLSRLPGGTEKVAESMIMRAHGTLAELYRMLEKQDKQTFHWQEALRLYKKETGDITLVQGNAPMDLGNFYWIIGEQELALAAYQEDLALKSSTAKNNPTQKTFRVWNMAVANLANLLAKTGRPNVAADLYGELTKNATSFLEGQSSPVIQGDLSYALLKQGELLRESGRLDEAIQAMAQSTKYFENVARGRQDQFNIMYGLASIYRSYANTLSLRIKSFSNNSGVIGSTRRDQRIKDVNTALLIYKKLIALDGELLNIGKTPGIGTDTILHDVTAIAELSALNGENNASIAVWKNAAELARAIYGESDGSAARTLLTEETLRASAALLALEQAEQALVLLDRTAFHYRKPAADPTDLIARYNLSRLLGYRAWIGLISGKAEEALRDGEKSRALYDDLNPTSAKINLAHAYLLNKRFDLAKAIYVKYAGTIFDHGRKWNDEVLNDFRQLRKAGRGQTDMKTVEDLLIGRNLTSR